MNYLISKMADVFSVPTPSSRGKTCGKPRQAQQLAEARPQSAAGHPVSMAGKWIHHNYVKTMYQWEAGVEATVAMWKNSGNWHKTQ